MSLTCCLAGLLVGFPVDYRYEWNLANPDHQRMLNSALYHFQPEVLIAEPKCKFFSISSSRRKWSELLRDRESERPTLTIIHEPFAYQDYNNRGYLLEQPWSSAMFKESVMIRNQDLKGWRKAKRTDQCAFGAVDELRRPV